MSGAHILVVDDDLDMQDVMALALEAGDYQVCRASNGQEALERVEACAPDLILLDMRMPVMDGWAFAAELRRRHGHRIPVVVCTGRRGREAARARGRRRGLSEQALRAGRAAAPRAGGPASAPPAPAAVPGKPKPCGKPDTAPKQGDPE
jgi:urea transport system substrate-binding protein